MSAGGTRISVRGLGARGGRLVTGMHRWVNGGAVLSLRAAPPNRWESRETGSLPVGWGLLRGLAEPSAARLTTAGSLKGELSESTKRKS